MSRYYEFPDPICMVCGELCDVTEVVSTLLLRQLDSSGATASRATSTPFTRETQQMTGAELKQVVNGIDDDATILGVNASHGDVKRHLATFYANMAMDYRLRGQPACPGGPRRRGGPGQGP